MTIKYEKISRYPRDMGDDLAEVSKAELFEGGPMNFGAAGLAQYLWRVTQDDKVLVYLSVYRPNLFALPELGVYIGKGLVEHPVKGLKALRRTFPDLLAIVPKMRVRVEEGYARGKAFAEFFGFRLVETRDGYYRMEN